MLIWSESTDRERRERQKANPQIIGSLINGQKKLTSCRVFDEGWPTPLREGQYLLKWVGLIVLLSSSAVRTRRVDTLHNKSVPKADPGTNIYDCQCHRPFASIFFFYFVSGVTFSLDLNLLVWPKEVILFVIISMPISHSQRLNNMLLLFQAVLSSCVYSYSCYLPLSVSISSPACQLAEKDVVKRSSYCSLPSLCERY